jgi:acid phosphatase class B
LYAIIFVYIHDAPRGFTVSGQTKGESGACPICVDRTASVYLPSSRKLLYMGHRRFLPRKHKYHKMKNHFDNTIEKDSAPKQYTEKLVFEMVKNIEVVFGNGTIKGQKRKKTLTPTDIPLKKQSNFSSTFGTGRIFRLATILI